MSKVVVRCIPNELGLTIAFKFNSNVTNLQDIHVKLERLQTEQLSRCLERISLSLQKKLSKSCKLKKVIQPSFNIQLLRNERPLNVQLSNFDAWQNGSVLQINESFLEVHRNPPTVKNIEFLDSVMAGFPIYPKIDFEFCDCENSEFAWYKDSFCEKNLFFHSYSDSASCIPKAKSWEKVSSTLIYSPVNRDIGCFLKFICTPKSKEITGQPYEIILPAVEAGPGFCPFENRHMFTRSYTGPNSIRVVSYNILADVYASTDKAQTILFSHCPLYVLKIEYRNQLLLKELTGYNGDLLCLQEVDYTVYNSCLVHSLAVEGFLSEMKLKGHCAEGLVIFYRKSKFRLLATHDIHLAHALTNDENFADFFEQISENPKLMESVLTKKTSLQVLMLKCLTANSKILCIANTHLYYAPYADHIRIVQAAICMRHIEIVVQHYKRQYPLQEISLIFAGDFNCCPQFGIYQFMVKGKLPSDFHKITNAGDESLKEMTLHHPFYLESACGIPKYTNFVPDFKGTLDYIFYDRTSFKVSQIIPMPTDEEVQAFQALPNSVFPSDHIALISDLTWLKS